MKGLIILEGADGTGKTTLAKALCERFNGHYIHNTYRWPKKMPLYHTAALHRAIKLSQTQLVVIDRLWMSEAIYAEVYRGGSPWPHMGRMLDRIVRKHAGLYIICNRPEGHSEKFDQLRAEREEMYDNVDNVAQRYEELFWGGFNSLDNGYCQQLSVRGMQGRDDVMEYRIDVQGRNIPVFIDMAIGTMQRNQGYQFQDALSADFNNFAGFVHTAEFAFVGDRTNSKIRAIDWPFYDVGHCSAFLADCLHRHMFDETRAVWFNANGPQADYIMDEMADMGLRFVSLGGEAFEALHRRGLGQGVIKLMHPSYAKRFNKQPEFMRELRGVIGVEYD